MKFDIIFLYLSDESRYANTNNIMKNLCNIIFILFLVIGCSNESQYSNESPIGHSWKLREVGLNGGELIPIPSYANYYWSFEEKSTNLNDSSTNSHIEGYLWCNWFSVFVNVSETTISFSPFILTPATCSYLEEHGDIYMALEAEILSLYTKGNLEYEIIYDYMYLETEDGTTLVFQRVRE